MGLQADYRLPLTLRCHGEALTAVLGLILWSRGQPGAP